MIRACLMAVLIVVLNGCPELAWSADDTTGPAKAAAAFAALRQAATQIPDGSWIAKPTEEGARGRAVIAKIRVSEANLEHRFMQSKEASAGYVVTIRADAASTERAKRADDQTRALGMLVAVSDDLATKIDHANVAGAATSLGNDVPVTVKTTAGGKEAPGYLVRLNCRADEDSTSPEFVFNDPSTPTSGSLAPGNYVLWLEKSGKKYSRRYVTIKAVSGPAVTIVVDVVP